MDLENYNRLNERFQNLATRVDAMGARLDQRIDDLVMRRDKPLEAVVRRQGELAEQMAALKSDMGELRNEMTLLKKRSDLEHRITRAEDRLLATSSR